LHNLNKSLQSATNRGLLIKKALILVITEIFCIFAD